MIHNTYISYINDYITHNTPVDFILLEDTYQTILTRFKKEDLSVSESTVEIICASYTLLYTSLAYHKLANTNLEFQPYYILIGDYISSYVVEIMYKNQLYKLLKLFSHNTKKMMLDILNNQEDDCLLDNIVLAFK